MNYNTLPTCGFGTNSFCILPGWHVEHNQDMYEWIGMPTVRRCRICAGHCTVYTSRARGVRGGVAELRDRKSFSAAAALDAMLVLYETPAGYALFKTLKDNKLAKVDSIHEYFEDEDRAKKFVTFQAFSKFTDTNEALEAATALCDGTLNKNLKSFLKKVIVKKNVSDTLVVADPSLGAAIKDKLGIQCLCDSMAQQLYRGIRSQLSSLLTGMPDAELRTMTLGLSHSLSRHKIKFSPDKVDTMIIQAIALLDELDKELNTYAMRVREWYGWHFPEMAKIVPDTIVYAKVPYVTRFVSPHVLMMRAPGCSEDGYSLQRGSDGPVGYLGRGDGDRSEGSSGGVDGHRSVGG